jgi:hypothetical protein
LQAGNAEPLRLTQNDIGRGKTSLIDLKEGGPVPG